MIEDIEVSKINIFCILLYLIELNQLFITKLYAYLLNIL